MASIAFYAAAYRGDVYPYVPIASELARRGHRVTYVVPEEFHADFAAEPFECMATGTDFSPKTLNLPENAAYVAKWGMNGAMLLRLYLGKMTVPYLDTMFDTGRAAAQVVDADIMVMHPGSLLVARMIAEDLDLPWVMGDLFPMVRPSAAYPPPGMVNLGRRGNAWLWKFGKRRFGGIPGRLLSGEHHLEQFRKRRGLKPMPYSFIDQAVSPWRDLGLVSEHYLPPEPDWAPNYRTTGFTHWSGPGGGELPGDVVDFLDAGDPPIVVSLGTSASSAKPELLDAVRESLDAAGKRGLFLTSTDSIAQSLRATGGRNPHGVWPFVPIRALLPRAAGVVHSGAHGTNALALEAGLPSVMLPVLFDQAWHACRQETLGTGIGVRKPSKLGAAIDRLIHDSTMRETAAAFGRLIADEDGVGNAANEIEGVLAAS